MRGVGQGMLRERGLHRGPQSLHGKAQARLQGALTTRRMQMKQWMAAAVLAGAAAGAAAQNFPAKPITMAVVFANVLVVQPELPVKTLREYVDYARKNPGKVTYASSGIGGAGHLAGELLRKVAKIDIVHVPYKGGGPAMQGFLGKQVDSFFATPVSSIKQIQAGKARAIATTGEKRAGLMPDVPTVAESGYSGYEALNWYAYLGPAKMPRQIVDRLNKEITTALKAPEVVSA